MVATDHITTPLARLPIIYNHTIYTASIDVTNLQGSFATITNIDCGNIVKSHNVISDILTSDTVTVSNTLSVATIYGEDLDILTVTVSNTLSSGFADIKNSLSVSDIYVSNSITITKGLDAEYITAGSISLTDLYSTNHIEYYTASGYSMVATDHITTPLARLPIIYNHTIYTASIDVTNLQGSFATITNIDCGNIVKSHNVISDILTSDTVTVSNTLSVATIYGEDLDILTVTVSNTLSSNFADIKNSLSVSDIYVSNSITITKGLDAEYITAGSISLTDLYSTNHIEYYKASGYSMIASDHITTPTGILTYYI